MEGILFVIFVFLAVMILPVFCVRRAAFKTRALVCMGGSFPPLPVAGVVDADEHLAAGGRVVVTGMEEGAGIATALEITSCRVLMVRVLSNGMKDVLNVLVPMDKAGRIVLPRNVRQELAIEPGDVLREQGSNHSLALV